MAIKTTFNDDGSASVEVTHEDQVFKDPATGKDLPPTSSRWSCRRPDQVEKHLSTWSDASRPQGERLSPGETSALRDQVNEREKQLAS